MNAFAVFEYQNQYDDPLLFAVFLDETKCDKFINEHNKDWMIHRRMEDECYDCTRCSCGFEDDDKFMNKDSCGRYLIKTDRHGQYCANDLTDAAHVDVKHYSKQVIPLIE